MGWGGGIKKLGFSPVSAGVRDSSPPLPEHQQGTWPSGAVVAGLSPDVCPQCQGRGQDGAHSQVPLALGFWL